jgi:ribonuclease P protein component
MLKKNNRLLKKKDFDAVWQKGRSSYDQLLGVKSLANNLGENRFGIMVGLKVSKKAVERNKIKRRIRAIIRVEAAALAKGFDVVITVLPAAKKSEFAVFQASLLGHLRKLRIVKP